MRQAKSVYEIPYVGKDIMWRQVEYVKSMHRIQGGEYA